MLVLFVSLLEPARRRQRDADRLARKARRRTRPRMKTTDRYLQRRRVNHKTRSVVAFLALITYSHCDDRNAAYHNILTQFSKHIMAARFVAWTSRILRRGGSPGAVSSFI